MKRIATLIVLLAFLSVTRLLHAEAIEQFGPDQPDRETIAEPGWPGGIELPLRHPSRVYSVGDHSENFYFNATPDQINELLDLYSKARLRDHEVKLEFGKPTTSSLMDKRSFNYNLDINVISGLGRFMSREDDTNNGRTLEPSLTLYLDEKRVVPKELKLPDNVIVTGNADLPELKVKRTLPERKAYYGKIQLDDGDASNGVENGVSTRITYWEIDDADGIEVAQSNRDGLFKVVLSIRELAAIKNGNAWLTTTTGNFLTKASKDAGRFPGTMLNEDKVKVQALKILAPRYFYGRLMFDDGTPAILKHEPWPGARIDLTFPYAGMAHLDDQGYFQICLERDQFDELLKRGASKNIYIPDQEQGRATAREEFPVRLLSQDKASAGQIKIKKPVYGPQP